MRQRRAQIISTVHREKERPTFDLNENSFCECCRTLRFEATARSQMPDDDDALRKIE